MALSLELITATARSLLVQYGLQDVTMRRLAKELDVAAGALYYHVPSKQELLRAVAHEILTPLQSAPGEPLQLMVSFRDLVLPLRDVGDLLLLAYALDATLPPARLLQRRLTASGWPPQQAEDTAAMVMRFALGAVATEQNQALFARDGQSDPAPVDPAEVDSAVVRDETAGAARKGRDTLQPPAAERIYLQGLQRLLIRP